MLITARVLICLNSCLFTSDPDVFYVLESEVDEMEVTEEKEARFPASTAKFLSYVKIK